MRIGIYQLDLGLKGPPARCGSPYSWLKLNSAMLTAMHPLGIELFQKEKQILVSGAQIENYLALDAPLEVNAMAIGER